MIYKILSIIGLTYEKVLIIYDFIDRNQVRNLLFYIL